MRAAAFFDLDRTVISRATPIALARSFHRHRLVRRRDLARAALWQLIFLVRGVGEREMRRAAEDGMMLLRDVPVEAVDELLAEAMETVLRPLIYREPVELARRHQNRDEPVYLISASLQQIVERIADDLGFDGAVGSTCEIRDGVYTGRSLRPCYGTMKATVIREIAQRDDLDLARSTAYSDSHTDLALLEAVGHPAAVNPDRRLKALALEQGWPIHHFTDLTAGTRDLLPPRGQRSRARRSARHHTHA